MKRSSNVKLVHITSVAALSSALMLSACNDEAPNVPTNGTFSSKEECSIAYSMEVCEKAEKEALATHEKNAPRFSRLEECVAEYGKDMCRPSTGSSGGDGGFFVPMMMGYMLGSMNSTPAPLYYGPASSHSGNSAPVYSSSSKTPVYAGQSTYKPSAKADLKGSTALKSGTVRGGFGTSFEPTKSFMTHYKATNPTAFNSTTAQSAKASSSSKSSVSRGGFGSSGRGNAGS